MLGTESISMSTDYAGNQDLRIHAGNRFYPEQGLYPQKLIMLGTGFTPINTDHGTKLRVYFRLSMCTAF